MCLEERKLEDQQLMARAQGDRAAFDHLVARYREKIAAFCSSLLDNTTAGEDAAIEVFETAWRKRDTYQPTGSVSGWLYAIARNHCLNRLRPSGVRTVPDAENRILVQQRDPKTLPGDDFWFQLKEVMKQRLTSEERLICLLHYREQYPVAEVAEMLDMNPNTLKSQIQRKIQPAIKEILQEFSPDLHPAARQSVL